MTSPGMQGGGLCRGPEDVTGATGLSVLSLSGRQSGPAGDEEFAEITEKIVSDTMHLRATPFFLAPWLHLGVCSS